MCGRYLFTAESSPEIQQIIQEIQQRSEPSEWKVGEVFPSNRAPVLVPENDKIAPDLLTWGFQTPKALIINARSETVEEKPTFRESIQMRRCVIPASGFYEWSKDKRKYFFQMPEEQALYMAGIYQKRGDEWCYCILTTAPNKSVKEVHDRMPLVLPKRSIQDWIMDHDGYAGLLSSTPPELTKTAVDAQTGLW